MADVPEWLAQMLRARQAADSNALRLVPTGEHTYSLTFNSIENPEAVLGVDRNFAQLARVLTAIRLPDQISLPVVCYQCDLKCPRADITVGPDGLLTCPMTLAIMPVPSLDELARIACATPCVARRYMGNATDAPSSYIMPGCELYVITLTIDGILTSSRDFRTISEPIVARAVDPEIVRAAGIERVTVLATVAGNSGADAALAQRAREVLETIASDHPASDPESVNRARNALKNLQARP